MAGMSYQLLSETEPVARKQYRCIWCPEKIDKGTKHVHESSKYDGDFQDHRWHLECYAASRKYFSENGECEFMPHENRRGSTESHWETIVGGKDDIGRIL